MTLQDTEGAVSTKTIALVAPKKSEYDDDKKESNTTNKKIVSRNKKGA